MTERMRLVELLQFAALISSSPKPAYQAKKIDASQVRVHKDPVDDSQVVSAMDSRVFIDGKSALDVIRRARAAGRWGVLHPTKVRTLSGCAYKKGEVMKAIDSLEPDMRSLMPRDLGSAESPVHITVPRRGNRTRASGVVTHVHTGAIAPGTYLQLCEGVFILSAEACFARLAPKLSVPRRVTLAMELAGSYVFSPADGSYRFDIGEATTIERLADYCSKMPHSSGTGLQAALSSLAWAAQNSASPMETVVVALLTLPYRYGGYGIGLPRMNVALNSKGLEVPAGTRACRKPDIAWIEHGLALEYNGREAHNGLDDYERDSDRRDELEGIGLRVIPISAGKLYDVDRFHELACEVARTTGKKLQLPHDFEQRRAQLRATILPRRRTANR